MGAELLKLSTFTLQTRFCCRDHLEVDVCCRDHLEVDFILKNERKKTKIMIGNGKTMLKKELK